MLKEFGDSRNERLYRVECSKDGLQDFFISARVLKNTIEACLNSDFQACDNCIMPKVSEAPLCSLIIIRSSLAVIQGLERRIEDLSFQIGIKKGGNSPVKDNKEKGGEKVE